MEAANGGHLHSRIGILKCRHNCLHQWLCVDDLFPDVLIVGSKTGKNLESSPTHFFACSSSSFEPSCKLGKLWTRKARTSSLDKKIYWGPVCVFEKGSYQWQVYLQWVRKCYLEQMTDLSWDRRLSLNRLLIFVPHVKSKVRGLPCDFIKAKERSQ